jgi:hypothetical protein
MGWGEGQFGQSRAKYGEVKKITGEEDRMAFLRKKEWK